MDYKNKIKTTFYNIFIYILTYFVLVFIYDQWYGNELLMGFILWAFLGYINIKIFQILIKKYGLKSILYIFLIDVGILILGLLIASAYVMALLPYMGFIMLMSLSLFLMDFIENAKIKIGILFSVLIILFIPFIIKYPGFCEKNDWRCMSNRAILVDNPSFCKHMMNEKYFTMCMSYTAGQTINPGLCDNLNNENDKIKCYSEVLTWASSRYGSVKEKGNELEIIKGLCPKLIKSLEEHDRCVDALSEITKAIR